MENKGKISFNRLFWLFMAGSLLGVVIEGVFCYFKFGHWETHTVTVWGPFCSIYGLGMAGFYVGSVLMKNKSLLFKFVMYAVIADIIQLICGLVLRYGLNMKAWTYKNHFMNFKEMICLDMTLAWGLFGILFSQLLAPRLEGIFNFLDKKLLNVFCVAFSVFFMVDLIFSGACMIRYAERHNKGTAPSNSCEEFIDRRYDDARMKKIFCEWRFLS